MTRTIKFSRALYTRAMRTLPADPGACYTVAEVAELWACSTRTVIRRVRNDPRVLNIGKRGSRKVFRIPLILFRALTAEMMGSGN